MTKMVIKICIVLFIINGCATYVNVNVQKPSKISLGKIRNVAILDIDKKEFRGSYSFTEIGDAPLSEKLETIIEGKKKPKNPILKDDYFGKIISDKLISKLVDNGHYSIADRDKLDRILDEQKLSLSGLISSDDEPIIGELIGVDAFVIGSGKYFIIDKGGWFTHANDNKIFKDVFYKVEREISLELKFEIISVESGEIVALIEEKKKKTVKANGDDLESAFANLSNWHTTIDKLTDSILNKIIKQIAPYYKKTSKLIKTGGTTGMKTGKEYAKRNMWEDAKDSWEQVLKDSSPKGIKDKVPAMYNLGVYYEIQDNLDKAEEIFNQCFKQSGKKEYLNARQRIQKRKKEIEKFEEQISN